MMARRHTDARTLVVNGDQTNATAGRTRTRAIMRRMARTTDTPGLTEYLTALAGEDEALARVNRETGEMPNAVMQSRPDQGALLTILARLVGARQALEVGTFTGYGAICIARGLAPGGRLTCLEYSPEYAAIARRNLERAGVADRVTVVEGPAMTNLPDGPLDFVYIDADKMEYPAYYDALVPRVRPGGLLVLDNTLLGGRVLNPQEERGRTMDLLNRRIAEDERVDSVLLGLADGMTLARVR
jgi:caffeoyl-CoA O-methyltransferase